MVSESKEMYKYRGRKRKIRIDRGKISTKSKLRFVQFRVVLKRMDLIGWEVKRAPLDRNTLQAVYDYYMSRISVKFV
jgi:hypothetical protein